MLNLHRLTSNSSSTTNFLLACSRASAAIIRNLQLLYLYSRGTDMDL
jgi:hypothetical protein